MYKNPIIRGFNPDPSICYANGKYYLVTSTFQYFPGVPIYESSDLINWNHISNCLIDESQVFLDVESSGGIFAPTIRFHDGTFYMTTTNNSTRKHFIVKTNDIYGKWSEPIIIDQDGIDPSLLFIDDKVYFTSNGLDDDGISGIIQCEIDIKTGDKLTKTKVIWQGTGGRYLEGPHLYKIGNFYYLFASEGGTEYGHYIVYARSSNPYGPFIPYKNNPFLTNKDEGGYFIQGVGHGDIILSKDNQWYIVFLAFRQIDEWLQYHHLGRETFLTPIYLNDDGWFSVKEKKVLEFYPTKTKQVRINQYDFKNINFDTMPLYIRHKDKSKYEFTNDTIILTGTNKTLDDISNPTFLGFRQLEFNMSFKVDVRINEGIAGASIYMDEDHHFDFYVSKNNVIVKINIGPLKQEVFTYIDNNEFKRLHIKSDNLYYYFYNNQECIYKVKTKYVSTEVASGFTGVLLGLFSVSNKKGKAIFKNLKISYEEEIYDKK